MMSLPAVRFAAGRPISCLCTVTQVVEDAQRAVLGKRSYPTTEASLKLFRFLVLDHGLDDEPNKPDWNQWMAAWNEKYPNWRRSRAGNFARRVLKTYDELVHPPYVWPHSKSHEHPPRVPVPYMALENDRSGGSE